MSEAWDQWIDGRIADLEEAELLRELRPLSAESAVRVEADGRALTLFSTNDYLGLSSHPAVRRAVERAVRRHGMGPRGSPLICGYTDEHERLERSLSSLEMTEATLLCPTGFAANLAVLSSLAGPQTAIFSDELNHASIIDGCRLAARRGAEIQVYDHADVGSLEEAMAASDAPRKLVVTDSVFSMEGDLAPLDEIAAVKNQHDALLVIDEAHGTLVLGESGAGASERFGVSEEVDINVGTLSKAVGALGGFVSTSERLRTWLFNRGRSYVYSTAAPVPVVAAARAGLETAADQPQLRRRLGSHIERLAEAVGRPFATPIIPIIVGQEAEALTASAELFERGIHCTAIRPPTVPPGTARLRVTLSAAHTEGDIDRLIEALDELGLLET